MTRQASVEYLPRRARLFCAAVTALAVLLLVAPIVYSLLWVFWGSPTRGVLEPQPTLRWLSATLESVEWRGSIALSYVLALTAATAAVVIALTRLVPLALSEHRGRDRQMSLFLFVSLLPLLPTAVGLRHYVRVGALSATSATLLGFSTGVLPLVYLVLGRTATVGFRSEYHAARSLGADWLRGWYVVGARHWIRPIGLAFLVAVLVLLDEAVFPSTLMAGPQWPAVVKVWLEAAGNLTPMPAAVAWILALPVLAAVGAASLVKYVDADKWLRIGRDARLRQVLVDYWVEVTMFAASILAIGIFGDGLFMQLLVLPSLAVGITLIVARERALRRERLVVSRVMEAPQADVPELQAGLEQLRRSEMLSVMARVKRLAAGSTEAITADERSELTGQLFACVAGAYFGTDSSVPSLFLKKYPEYFRQETVRAGRTFVRVLKCERDALTQDLLANPTDFIAFVKHHAESAAPLLRVSPSDAEEARDKLGLPSGDFGLFGGRVLMTFEAAESDPSKTVVSVRAVRGKNDPVFQYFSFLLQKADRIGMSVTADPEAIFDTPEADLVLALREQLDILERA